jgi:hypothetical protein
MGSSDQERKVNTERAAAKIAALLPALRKAGIDKALIDYDGSHGDGTIFIITAPPDTMPPALGNELQESVHDLLPDDWQAEEGSLGSATLDTTQGTITIDHSRREIGEEEDIRTHPPPADPDDTTPHAGQERKAIAGIAALLPILRAAHVDKVFVHYNGVGDSGIVEDIRPETIPSAVQDEIQAHAYNLLPDGWMDDQGSHGIVIIDVHHGAITVNHKWRVLNMADNERYSYTLF